MAKSRIEALRERHLSLLERSQQKEIGEETLQEIKTFLVDVRNLGSDVSDPQERDLLRSFLFYWGNFVYDRTGSYPGMALPPYLGAGPRKEFLSRWRAWQESLPNWLVWVVVGAIVVGATIVGLWFFRPRTLQLIWSYLSTRQPLTVWILQPRDKDSVPYEMEIIGRYEGNLAGRNLWIIVRPQGSDLYYPQRPAKIQRDKSWFVTARFGQDTPGEGGKVFDIFVYLASSQEADQALQEYIDKAEKNGKWPGMPPPSGLTQLDQVRVTRQIPLIMVQILQPRDKDSIPYETEVSGRYEGNLAGQNLWVIVHPQSSDRYYPQGSAKIQGDNAWFVTARLGQDTPEEGGKPFDILVYLASSQADQTLQEYVDEAEWKDEWPGMSPLADGLTLLDLVTVIRQ